MRKLARARPGEEHPVGRTQPANLAFKVGAELHEASALIDEAVPYVDIVYSAPCRALAKQPVEKQHVRRRLLPLHGGKTNPDDRRRALPQRCRHSPDSPGVDRDPALIAKLTFAFLRQIAFFAGNCSLIIGSRIFAWRLNLVGFSNSLRS